MPCEKPGTDQLANLITMLNRSMFFNSQTQGYCKVSDLKCKMAECCPLWAILSGCTWLRFSPPSPSCCPASQCPRFYRSDVIICHVINEPLLLLCQCALCILLEFASWGVVSVASLIINSFLLWEKSRKMCDVWTAQCLWEEKPVLIFMSLLHWADVIPHT